MKRKGGARGRGKKEKKEEGEEGGGGERKEEEADERRRRGRKEGGKTTKDRGRRKDKVGCLLGTGQESSAALWLVKMKLNKE